MVAFRFYLRRKFFSHLRPKLEAENNVDPDYGNDMLCAACRLPIFSTPTSSSSSMLLHDQCAAHLLPAKLEAHPLHPRGDLILHQQSTTTSIISSSSSSSSCSRCGSICGTSFYKCPPCDDDECDYQLDLACALAMRILHRSHHHRLKAIKGKSLSSISCAACGTQHQHPGGCVPDRWQVSYTCGPCDFWIHPDCALLPNAVVVDSKHHPHPLLLTYLDQNREKSKCSICDHRYDRSNGSGAYACFHCGYSAHIKCVVYSYPDLIHFEPVKLRDAQVPDLLRLPMPNESTSLMPHIFTNKLAVNICSPSSGGGDHDEMISNGQIHEHPLRLGGNDDDPRVARRVCNACVQLISPPTDPFYKCDEKLGGAASRFCRDFFLHKCCAHLPTTLQTQHTAHVANSYDGRKHPLTLLSKPPDIPRYPFNMFVCHGCYNICNGFVYACGECGFHLDVVCALMHTSITHDGHAHSHILRPVPGHVDPTTCVCCAGTIDHVSHIAYECNSCRYFKIHAKCAILPGTVTHKFDAHPLKLITTQTLINTTTNHDHHHHRLVRGEQMFCEICENDINDTRTWYYGCEECDNYFHTACIPCLDELSNIKFGFTIRLACHACPLTCVRALSVDGYRCGCGTCDRIIITQSDELAFECSECYFRIRKECAARETMLCQQAE